MSTGGGKRCIIAAGGPPLPPPEGAPPQWPLTLSPERAGPALWQETVWASEWAVLAGSPSVASSL